MLEHPSQHRLPRRTIGLRVWTLLGYHAAIFGLFVALLPTLIETQPDRFDTNAARLAIPAWAGIVVLHLLATALIDRRMIRLRARAERIRKRIERDPVMARQATSSVPIDYQYGPRR
jgi:hypothetical protein